MVRRKAKLPRQNKKPPLLPPWAWQLLAVTLGKSLGVVLVKLLGAIASWSGIPWP